MANINSMSPRTGRIIKEDNTIVNEADGINADGSKNIRASARKAITITPDEEIEPTIGIVASEDTNATVLFADDIEMVEVKLLAGVIYPYSIKKVVVGDDIVGLYP